LDIRRYDDKSQKWFKWNKEAPQGSCINFNFCIEYNMHKHGILTPSISFKILPWAWENTKESNTLINVNISPKRFMRYECEKNQKKNKKALINQVLTNAIKN
jgi:hypothetical protein